MASSNNIKDLILTLFPDNNQQEISAADMRIFVASIFNNKEELVIKAQDEADMKSKNDKIYEESIVIIKNDGANSGVYVSRANNPISLLQLDKIADLADGSAVPGTPISDFMIEYTHKKNYLDAVYSYNNNNLSQTILSEGAADLYDIQYLYTGKNITQTSINEINGKTSIITFNYTGKNITSKNYVLIG